jgi:hypothetical protein
MDTCEVDGGTGQIVVSGTGGYPGEKVRIQVFQGTTSVYDQVNQMPSPNAQYTVNRSAGTYRVTVTAPNPDGTVFDFLGVVVS